MLSNSPGLDFGDSADKTRAADLIQVRQSIRLSSIMTPLPKLGLIVEEVVSEIRLQQSICTYLEPYEGADSLGAEKSRALTERRFETRLGGSLPFLVLGDQGVASAHCSNKPLLEFLSNLDRHSGRLVSFEGKIVGVIEDDSLERLPARIALMAEVWNVEQLLNELFAICLPDPLELPTLVEPRFLGTLRAGLNRAAKVGEQNFPLRYVDFAIKLHLLPVCLESSYDCAWLNEEADAIRSLRNVLAHFTPFGGCMSVARKARGLIRLRDILSERVSEL